MRDQTSKRQQQLVEVDAIKKLEENKTYYSNIDKNQLFENASSAVDVLAYPLPNIGRFEKGLNENVINAELSCDGSTPRLFADAKQTDRRLNSKSSKSFKDGGTKQTNDYKCQNDFKNIARCFDIERVNPEEIHEFRKHCYQNPPIKHNIVDFRNLTEENRTSENDKISHFHPEKYLYGQNQNDINQQKCEQTYCEPNNLNLKSTNRCDAKGKTSELDSVPGLSFKRTCLKDRSSVESQFSGTVKNIIISYIDLIKLIILCRKFQTFI